MAARFAHGHTMHLPRKWGMLLAVLVAAAAGPTLWEHAGWIREVGAEDTASAVQGRCVHVVDGRDLGLELLVRGLAEPRREPHARQAAYREATESARRQKVGIHGGR